MRQVEACWHACCACCHLTTLQGLGGWTPAFHRPPFLASTQGCQVPLEISLTPAPVLLSFYHLPQVYQVLLNGVEPHAAKVFRLGSDPRAQLDFLEEASLLRLLRHRSIVGFAGVCVARGHGIILMVRWRELELGCGGSWGLAQLARAPRQLHRRASTKAPGLLVRPPNPHQQGPRQGAKQGAKQVVSCRPCPGTDGGWGPAQPQR